MATDHEVAQLRAEIDELRRQLAEATDTLRAIQSGEVDALVVASRDGRELYTLESAYEPYRVFVEHMQEGAASLAADGVILYANQRFADIVRFRHERLLGNSIYDVLGPKNRPLVANLIARSATQSAQADLALDAPDDEPVHVSLSVTAAPDGTRCFVLADLTDRVRLSKAITTRDWLRVTLTSIGDAVVSCDLDGRITFFNTVAAALTGWLEGEAIGQPADAVVRLVDETTGGPVENPLSRVLAEGQTILLGNHTALLARDGRVISIEDSAAPIRDDDGVMTGAVLVFHDVTEKRRFRRELEASEAKFRALFEHSPDAVLLTDPDGPVLAANPAACALFEMTEEELCARGRAGLLDESDPRYARAASDRRRTGLVSNRELTYFRKNGERFAGETSSVILPGDSTQSFVVIRDITERRRGEAHLALMAEISQEFSRLTTADDIMQAVGARVATFLHATNCLFAEIDEAQGTADVQYAWSAPGMPEVVGVYRLSDFVTPAFRFAARAGETIVIGNTQTDPRTDAARYAALQIHAYVTVPFHRGGQWKYLFTVNASVAREWRPDEIELIREITSRTVLRLERARAEAALRRSEERFRIALQSSPIVVFSQDLALRYTWVYNPSPGFKVEDVLGKRDDEVYAPEDAATFTAIKRDVLTTGAARRDIVTTHRSAANGGDLIHDMTTEPLRDVSGALVGVICAAMNVTELHHMQEALRENASKLAEANRMKDDFLATLSHELRTPMTAVVGWAQLLTARPMDNATIARGLDAIRRNSQAQLQLINDMLDVSRIVSGRLRLETRPVDLVRVVYGALDAVRPAADAKGVVLTTSIAASSPVIAGDADRLQQVAWNLLSNAVKFTPRGGRVEVSLRRTRSQFALCVRDSGVGIDPAFLPHVFERFSQQDASAARRHGGLGLGLSIVRHLVELHGGTVVAESEGEGKGASFTIHLPVRAVEMPGQQGDTRPPHEPVAERRIESLTGTRVLVVDDEADARDLISTVLAAHGAEVAVEASASAALETLQRGQFDVLVADIGMPDEDGYQFIARVRTLPFAPANAIPALALTAYGRADDVTRALASGFQMHLAKPVSPQALTRAVAQLVQGCSQQT